MKKRVLSLIISLCMLLVLIPVPAYAATVIGTGEWGKNDDKVIWTLYSDGTLEISGSGALADSCQIMNGGEWELTRGWGLHDEEITAVIIKEGVTSIGSMNFENTPNLQRVVLADSVTEIDSRAFQNCDRLTDITFGSGLVETDVQVFYDCDALTSVTLPNYDVDYGNSFFGECDKLKEIIIPENVTTLGGSMFTKCTSLTSVVIPDTVLDIGGSVFEGCTNLKQVTLPSTLKEIPRRAFATCTSLKTIDIPDTVVSVGDEAFYFCQSLTELILPEGLIEMGTGVISNCDKLKTLTVPSTVMWMRHTFQQAYRLESVKFLGNYPKMGSHAFSGANVTAYYPGNYSTWTEDVLQNYNGTVNWVSYESELPQNPVWAYGTCGESLTWKLMTDGTLTISGTGYMDLSTLDWTWEDYKNHIKHVVIEEGVTTVADSAFYQHPNIETVSLPDSLTSIGRSAFNKCTSLREITIPENVKSIPSSAFSGCENLQKVTMGSQVNKIGQYAFSDCTALTEITFHGDAPEIGNNAFQSVTATAYYPGDNTTWTAGVLQNYGGNITWVPVGPEVEFVAASLSLKGDIGLNYYAMISERILADTGAYMKFTGSGAARYLAISQGVLDPSDGSYRFSIPLNAKNMGDSVTAQVYNTDGAVGDSKTLSIKYYADYVINNSSKETFVNLMKAMLNYGSAAQVNFGYDVENLVNADMAEADRLMPETLDVSSYAHTWSGEEAGIEITSASLLLQSETKIRIYFKLAEGKTLEDFIFTIDGAEVTPVQSGSEYYIEKTNVAAKDLDTMYTFCLGNRQLTYCGLSYVNQVLTYSRDENLINLAKALYAYNQAANAYFGQ